MSAPSKKPARRPAPRRPKLKLLPLPPGPELRRMPVWEVLTPERSLYLSLQLLTAQAFAQTFNASAPIHPAKVIERSAVIADAKGGGR